MTTRKDIHNSNVPIICMSCEARHKGICGALTGEQLTQLSKHTTKTAHAPETELHGTLNNKNTCANILSGVVKLSKLLSDGRQQIVGLQFAPDLMGSPFSTQSDITIETATDVRLCTFPKHILLNMLKQSPEMEHLLHEQTISELNEARDWLLTLGRKNASEKVASFILLIATHIDPERQNDDSPIVLKLPLKRAAIADYLGLTTETVSRQLTNLRKKNIITIDDRSTTTINDLKRLKQAADQD